MDPEKDQNPLATTVLNLPGLDGLRRNDAAAKMTWEEVMAQTEPQREFYMKHFDSPEKRLRNKNPEPFRMHSLDHLPLNLDKFGFDGPGGKLTNEEIDRIVYGV
jgi:hypothetical protein